MHAYSTNQDRLKVYVLLGLISALLTPPLNNALGSIGLFDSLQPWISSGPSFGLIYAALFALYNRFIWHIRLPGGLRLGMTADLRGTYKGKLISSYKQTEVPLSIEIEQTWTKLMVYLQTGTDTSESFSTMASVFELDGKSTRLTYTYTNTPFSAIADRDMQKHDGTANLIFRKDGSVRGTYFNLRLRHGSIELKKVKR